MSKSVSSLAVVFAAFCIFTFSASTALASTSGVVISQIYGGGGNTAAKYTHDYVELFNAGSAAVDISGWSVQYASTAGTNWSGKSTFPANTTLAPGQYYLVQEQAGTSTTPGDVTPDPSTDTFNMAAGHGNVALVSNDDPLSGLCGADGNSGAIVDLVGFGTGKCFEGGGAAPAAASPNANSDATIRNDGGCTDTDDNSVDFSDSPAPADAHNSSSASHLCTSSNNIVVSMADVGHQEGDSGTTAYDFVLTLSKPAPAGGVTFDIATADGTGADGATAPSDYTAVATSASIAAGASTYTATVEVNGDTTIEPDETFTITASNIKLGTQQDPSVNITDTVTATGTIFNDDATTAAIWEIQGSGAASPLVGQVVHTCGIVTVVGASGFYVQSSTNGESDATCNTDGNSQTSDGVYVFPSDAVTVIPGDLITFDAEVSEYYSLTELSFVKNLQILSQGNPLPPAVVFDANTPSTDPANLSCGDTNFECFESMLVKIDNGFVTQGSGYSKKPGQTYDYVYVTATGKRALREPGLLYGLTRTAGDNDASPIWDGNPEEFEMSPNEFPGVYDGSSTGTPINGGSTFTATGVIGYDFGSYEFYPATLDVNYAPMPRPVPTADPGLLRIGEFNVERFCDNVDDTVPSGTDPIPPGKELYECSGSSLPSQDDYDTKSQRLADYIGDVLALPDVVAIEEVENLDALTKLADKITTTYGVTYTPKLDEGNDVSGIDVGYLINESRVQIDSITQLDKDLMWHTPNNHDRNVFDHPPLLLQGIFTGGGPSQPFTVMVNHLKARQNVDKVDSNGDSTAQAKEDQEKRFRQAVAVALQVQSLQRTGMPQTNAQPVLLGITPQLTTVPTPLIVVGDFNAYQFTDGFANLVGMISGRYDFDANIWDLTDLTKWNLNSINPPFTDNNLVNPPLWDAVDSLPENERYSYLFAPDLGAIQGYGDGGEGSRKPPTDQVLDHALLNVDARANFVRMDYGRANLDAASEDEHNSTTAIGVSDHDGFVVQLTFDRIFANGFENKD